MSYLLKHFVTLHVSASSSFPFCTHKTENQTSHFPNVSESGLEKALNAECLRHPRLAQRDAGRRNMPLVFSVDVVSTAVQHTAKQDTKRRGS